MLQYDARWAHAPLCRSLFLDNDALQNVIPYIGYSPASCPYFHVLSCFPNSHLPFTLFILRGELHYLSQATLTQLWETSTLHRSSLLPFFISHPFSREMRITPLTPFSYPCYWKSSLDYQARYMSTMCFLLLCWTLKFTLGIEGEGCV